MRTRRISASSAAFVRRSRFSPARATSCGKLVIRSTGADCGSGADVTICGRADASAPLLDADGARIGEAGFDDMVEEDMVGEDMVEEDMGEAGAARDGAA